MAATRARERLVVTAVKAPADDGDQPSRFLTELGVEPKDVTGRPRRPLSVAALVAELRATTVDPPRLPPCARPPPAGSPGSPRSRDEEGQPLVPAAHPYRWWGLYEPTRSPRCRCATATSPSRSPAARWTSSPTPAPCSGSWAAR